MAEPVVESGQGAIAAVPLIDPTPPDAPAPGAEDQKPTIPEPTDETGKQDEGEKETPEQVEAKKLSRRQRQVTRERDARIRAETELKLVREQLAAKATTDTPDTPSEPKREDFQDYETYLRALATHDAKQETTKALKAEREERQKQEQQARQSASATEQQKNWAEREKSFKATATDYEEVANTFLDADEFKSLSDAARHAIVEGGPQVLYHLGKHPDFADDILDLSPRDQRAEILKLTGSLTKPAGKTASDAPPPLKPINGGRSNNSAITGNESQAEYEAKRKAMGAKWAR